MTKVSIKRALLQARAVALVAAALVFTVAFVVAGPEQTPKLVVARSIDFKVTSTTSGLSASPNAALLYPGHSATCGTPRRAPQWVTPWPSP